MSRELSSEVELGRELELEVQGDVVVADATAKSRTSLKVKVGTKAAGVSEDAVEISPQTSDPVVAVGYEPVVASRERDPEEVLHTILATAWVARQDGVRAVPRAAREAPPAGAGGRGEPAALVDARPHV